MIKFVGIVFVFLCSISIGVYINQTLKTRLSTITQLLDFLRELSNEIEHRQTPLLVFMKQNADNIRYKNLVFFNSCTNLIEDGISYTNAIQTSLDSFAQLYKLDKNECQLIKTLLCDLLEGDISVSTNRIFVCESKLSIIKEAVSCELLKKGKLATSFSILLGLAFMVIVY